MTQYDYILKNWLLLINTHSNWHAYFQVIFKFLAWIVITIIVDHLKIILEEVGRIKLVNSLFFKRINNISTPEGHFSTQYKFDYHPALIKTQ